MKPATLAEILKLPLFNASVIRQLAHDTSTEASVAIASALEPDMLKLRQTMEADLSIEANREVLKEQAHLCKSGAGYTGLARLQGLCEAIEHSCKQQLPELSVLTQVGGSIVDDSLLRLEQWRREV